MSTIAERFAEHAKSLPLRPVPVPEISISGLPLTVFGRAMTVSDASRLHGVGRQSDFEMFIEAIVTLSCDENGVRLFKDADKSFLRTGSNQIIERVGAELMRPRFGKEIGLPEPVAPTTQTEAATDQAEGSHDG